MEIILVWNNARSFRQHVADMKQFNQEHKNNPTNKFHMLNDMPLPSNFQPVNTQGGGKIIISPKRKCTLVPLWEVELPRDVQN